MNIKQMYLCCGLGAGIKVRGLTKEFGGFFEEGSQVEGKSGASEKELQSYKLDVRFPQGSLGNHHCPLPLQLPARDFF